MVSLYGDHGYHLGEKQLWCKTTNYEIDTRAPLIICPPGGTGSGTNVDSIVEFVDIYPTVVELCGLPLPSNLAGTSLVPAMSRPDLKIKEFALSQFPRPWFYKGRPEVMGYSMRTDQFRYTEWLNFESGETLARELYNRARDSSELNNLAHDPDESQKKIVKSFQDTLRAAIYA